MVWVHAGAIASAATPIDPVRPSPRPPTNGDQLDLSDMHMFVYVSARNKKNTTPVMIESSSLLQFEVQQRSKYSKPPHLHHTHTHTNTFNTHIHTHKHTHTHIHIRLRQPHSHTNTIYGTVRPDFCNCDSHHHFT